MSFGFYATYKRAANPHLPLNHRLSNLRGCIGKHAQRIEQSFYGTLERLCAIYTIDPEWDHRVYRHPKTALHMLDVLLPVVVAERTLFMEKYQTYIHLRQHEKRTQVGPNRRFLRELYAPTYYHPACTPLAPFREHQGFGYIDRQGSFVIEPQYERAEPFVNGIARVALGGRNYWIDTCGVPRPSGARDEAGP